MARTLKSDKTLFIATMLLVSVSLVMVYSASAVQALAKYQVANYFLYRQLAWAILGVCALFAAMRIDYRRYREPFVIWTLLAITIVLLLSVFFFAPINGTRRWMSLGYASLQPSELAKLAVILFTAALLERRMHRVNDPGYTLLPIGVVTFSLVSLILFQPDFGTAACIVGIVIAILFAAGLSYRYLFGAALLIAPAAVVLVASSEYRYQRWVTYLDPWKDELGAGFQIIQSLYAIGSGGLFGKGLMDGVQKLYYIPEPHTDFIFAVIAEEFGLVGTTVILLCFALIIWRGLRTSLLAQDRFGALLALGLTMMIGMQALLNISVVTQLLPTKGLPLPLVSNGGSSLLINLVSIGMLLNISQQSSAMATLRAKKDE
jgi:cell division protein FtsW